MNLAAETAANAIPDSGVSCYHPKPNSLYSGM